MEPQHFSPERSSGGVNGATNRDLLVPVSGVVAVPIRKAAFRTRAAAYRFGGDTMLELLASAQLVALSEAGPIARTTMNRFSCPYVTIHSASTMIPS